MVVCMSLLNAHLFLFTTHITQRKLIAGVVLAVIVVAALAFWLIRRRRTA
jgi:hypothetical protein